MGEYTEDIASVLQDITEDGALCTWIKPVDDEDPAVPGKAIDIDPMDPTTEDQVIENVPILVLPINRVLYESFRRVQPDLEVPQGRHQGLLPGAVSFVPKIKDICVLANGERYAVLFYDVYKPDGNPILYILQLHQEL